MGYNIDKRSQCCYNINVEWTGKPYMLSHRGNEKADNGEPESSDSSKLFFIGGFSLMVLALQIILAICFVGIAGMLIVDINKNHKGELKEAGGKKWAQGMFVGIFANFLDTLGCGSFAPSTFLYKTFKNVEDINIPGTLNVGDTFPVIFEALIFTTSVECEPIFLVAMCVAAMIGAYAFAEIITKWDINKIRIWLGCAMIATAIIMFCKNHSFGPFGSVGEGAGFLPNQWQFWVAVILNVVWGALMDIGFGLYAPCMATCLLLGCSSGVCFPVFMGSCALLMPANSVVFIKKGRYDAVATLGNFIGGCIGVFIAWKIITSLPMYWLINVVCVVLLWTAYSILSDRAKALKAAKAA